MSGSRVKYVDHTYRDFSRYIEDGGRLVKHKKSEANFPAKLHKMVSEPMHSHIITWMPHGRAFKIIDKDLLFTSVLPRYYLCKKYESFTRQMNAWGFKRLYQSGPDLGCHYHECFLRGLPKLTCLIRRLPPSLGKATPYPDGEPNFYTITANFPLPSALSSNPSTRSPIISPVGNPRAEEGAIVTSTLDPPSAPIQLHGQSNQESMAALTAPSLGASTFHHGQSIGIQYPSYSLTQESTTARATSDRWTNESPHQMSRYARGYQYPPPRGQAGRSYASATPTNYMPPLEHSNHYYDYDSSYGRHATQAQNPQYQYQTPQYTYQQQHQQLPQFQGHDPQHQYQSPRYTLQQQSYERPRFRYPPPQLPSHLSFTPGSETGGQLTQRSDRHYQGNYLDQQSLPLSPRVRGRHEGDAKSSERFLRNENESGLISDPLPYSPRSRERKKPDPPP